MRRRDLLAAAAAAPLGLAAVPSASARGQTASDEILFSSAEELAQLTALAYRQAAASGRLGEELGRTARRFAAQEEEHAAALRTTVEALGGAPPREPSSVPGLEAATGRLELVDLLAGLEERALAGYAAAVRQLTDPGLLGTVAQIMACDAQQLAVLRAAGGRAPVTKAFETGRR